MPHPLNYSRVESFISTPCDAITPPSPAAADPKRAVTHHVLTVSEILHVAVSPQPHVISQVPTHVIRIVINYNLIGIPQPIPAIPQIKRRDAEVEPAEPESRRSPSGQMPHMPATESARKVPVLPRMIQVVVRIVLPGIMSDPLAIRMNVRRVRMTLFVHIRMIRFDGMSSTFHRRGTVRRRMRRRVRWRAFVTASVSLGKSRNAKQQRRYKKAQSVFHIHLRK